MVWFWLTALIICGVLLIDHFEMVGRKQRPITVGGAIGAALMLAGAALILGLF